jgi:FkbM family methyltransferase
VIAFEFIPSNIEVLKINLELNPEISDRVMVGVHPVWETAGRKLYFVDWGPGSRVTADPNQYRYNGTCETATIDNIVEQNGIPTVNFIKMDIEGAEYPALKGAESTIRKFKPKLAISLYHQVSDFSDIPRWIDGLDLGYRFYLDHHTIFENETVLFGLPPNEPSCLVT